MMLTFEDYDDKGGPACIIYQGYALEYLTTTYEYEPITRDTLSQTVMFQYRKTPDDGPFLTDAHTFTPVPSSISFQQIDQHGRKTNLSHSLCELIIRSEERIQVAEKLRQEGRKRVREPMQRITELPWHKSNLGGGECNVQASRETTEKTLEEPDRQSRKITEDHGRPWEITEGHERPWKITEDHGT